MFSPTSLGLRPAASNQDAQHILVYVHFGSPVLLLIFFLAAFTTHSVVTASTDTATKNPQDQTGPGGKPLPSSKKNPKQNDVLDFSPTRKILFNWLSVGTIVTFLANAVVVILHALINREDNWWCGESVAVSRPS